MKTLTTGESFDKKIVVVIIPSKLVSYEVLLIPLLSFSYNHDQKSNFLHVSGLVTKSFCLRRVTFYFRFLKRIFMTSSYYSFMQNPK